MLCVEDVFAEPPALPETLRGLPSFCLTRPVASGARARPIEKAHGCRAINLAACWQRPWEHRL